MFGSLPNCVAEPAHPWKSGFQHGQLLYNLERW
jgi:hypothetical protein